MLNRRLPLLSAGLLDRRRKACSRIHEYAQCCASEDRHGQAKGKQLPATRGILSDSLERRQVLLFNGPAVTPQFRTL